MSSLPRPSEDLKSFLATLVLQCFVIVKLCVYSYLVLGRPWNDFELGFVITFFVFNFLLAPAVFSGTVEHLKLSDKITALSVLLHLVILFIISCLILINGGFQHLRGGMEKFNSYFFAVIDSKFSLIALFIVMITILLFQYTLIHNVRFLRDPEYRKQVEEQENHENKINKDATAETF